LMSIMQVLQNRQWFSFWNALKDWELIKLATAAGFTQFLVQILYLLSGQYTIISHATILSSFGGALIVV